MSSIPLPIVNGQLTITPDTLPAGIFATQLSLLTNGAPLVIQNATYTSQSQNQVTGQAKFLNTTWATVVVESDSETDLSIRFAAPASGWTFSTSFPDLPTFNAGANSSTYINFFDQLDFTSPVFVLTTLTGTDPQTQAPLVPGFNFNANANQPGELLGVIGTMMGGANALIYGTITLPTAWQITPPLTSSQTPWTVTPLPPGIFLTATLLASQAIYGDVSITDVDLQVYSPVTSAWANLNQTFYPMLGASANLNLSSSTTLAVLAVGIDSSLLSLYGDFGENAPSSLDALDDILGTNVTADFPQEVQDAFSALVLQSLSLQISMAESSYSIASVGVGIGFTEDITFNLPVLGKFVISDILATLIVDEPFSSTERQIGITLAGEITVSTTTLAVEVGFEGSRYFFTFTAAPDPLELGTFISTFGSDIGLPTDWFNFSISEFGLSIDVKNETYDVNGIVDASLALFGSGPDLLDVDDALFNIQYAASKWQASFQGTMVILGLGLQVSAQIGETSTILTVRLTDHTLGDLLSYMLSFISSGDFVLQSPWSVLNDIQLSDFVLTFNITQKTVSFIYEANEDFGFIQISDIGINYDYSISPITKAVTLALGGDFLGISYPMADDGTSKLSWPPLAAPAPSVPGKSTLLELRLLGFGQRLEIEGAADFTHVSQAIEAIEKSFTPPSNGQNLPPELLFNGDAGWIIGADFTVLDTVSISIVFDDPTLFGLAISLAGEKAGIFNGLSFEIMYKEVSPGVGEYSIWLTLPKAMQHIELGEIVITLPTIGVSVYTNGNFVVDMGYPYNNDYTKSFALDIFPFVGSGGLYFGYLSSASAPDLVPDPKGTGSFNPILELGFAMRVGIGYDGYFGPLTFSVGLTLDAGLVGILAFFQPYDPGYPSSVFFSMQGSIGISGWVKGSINFGIISASIDFELSAMASLTYITYQPMLITFSVTIVASVQAKVLFIHVHFSFNHTFSHTFTVGSASPAPWDTIPPVKAPKAISFMAFDVESVAPNQWTWAPTFAYPLPQNFAPLLYIAPIITAAADGGTPAPRIVSALFVQNPNPADLSTPNYISGSTFGVLAQAMLAWGLAAFLCQPNWDDLQNQTVSAIDLERMNAMLTAELNVEVFMQQGFSASEAQQVLNSLLMQGYIDTNNRVINPPPNSIAFPDLNFITASETQTVLNILTQYSKPVNLFSETDLETFIATLFASAPLTATPRPTDENSAVQTTIFPLPPSLSFSASGATQLLPDQPISDPNAYAALLADFFTQAGGSTGSMVPPSADETSVAAMVFRDYFYLLLTSAVNSATALIADFPHTVVAGDTISGLAAQYGIDGEELVEANLEASVLDTAAGWLAISGFKPVITAGMTLQNITSSMYSIPQPGQPVSALIDLTDVTTLNQSQRGLLQPAQVLTVPNISFTPQNSPTLASVSAAFANPATITASNGVTPIASAPLPALTPLQLASITFTVADYPAYNTVNAIAQQFGLSPADIRIQNPSLPAGDDNVLASTQSIRIASVAYTVPPNDSYSISRYFGLPAGTVLNPVIGTALVLTAQYTVQPGDSLFSIAHYLGISVDALTASIGAAPLAPSHALTVPPFAHKLAAGESFATLSHGFDLPLDVLTTLNQNTTPLFAVGSILDIPAKISVGTLVQELDMQMRQDGSAPGTAAIAQSLNRYMLNGLRLPAPGATLPTTPAEWAALPTQPLYSLTGQQFDVAAAVPASISLTLNGTLSWVSNASLSVPLVADEMALVNGAVAQLNSLAPAMPTVFNGWQSGPSRFGFGASQTWLAAEPQAFAAAVPQQSPLIWSFSTDLVSAMQSNNGLQLSPLVGRWSGGSLGTLTPPTGFAWGALISLPLRPARTVAGSSGSAGNIYNVIVNDGIRAQLKAILGWLSQSNTVSLSILYPSGSTLRSDIAGDADRLTISVATLENVAAPFAQLADPAAFLQVLQVGSYLDYQTVATPDGLPAALFANQVQAAVTLLVTIETASLDPVPGWANALLTTGDISTSGASLAVLAPTLTSEKLTLPGGQISFVTAPVTAPDDTQSIAQLYQMLGYVQVDLAGPVLGVAGMPIPPAQPDSDSTDWMYKKAIPLTSPVSSEGFSSTPPAAANPYALVVSPLPSQAYSFSLIDLFGNQVQPASLSAALPLPLGYYDALIGVENWASTAIAFHFDGTPAAPMLNLTLNFSAAKYQLSPDQSLQALLIRLNTDLQTMAQVYYQIHQPDVTFSIESSIGSVQSPQVTTVQSFVANVYAYLATLIALNENQGLTQSIAQTQADDTLTLAAQRTRTNPSTLAAMNRNTAGLLLTGSAVNLPVTYSVAQGDTPQSIATAKSTTPDALGTLNAAALLNAGVSLTILSGTYTTLKGDTLASIAQGYGAAGQSISPAQIVSANASAALWAAGTVLISSVTPYTVSAGDSLYSILQQAAAGQNPQPTLDTVLLANAVNSIALSEGVALIVPQHSQLDTSKVSAGMSVQTVASASSLADLEPDALDQTDLWYANANRADILNSSATLSLNGTLNGAALTIPLAIQPNDTPQTFYSAALLAIAAAVIGQQQSGTSALVLGGTTFTLALTPYISAAQLLGQLQAQLSASVFAVLISGLTIIRAGATLLLPPKAVTLTADITLKQPYAFTEITTHFVLQRDPALINPGLSATVQAKVGKAATAAAPMLNETGASSYSQQNLSLVNFATQFQRLFPAYLVATQPKQGNSAPPLWAVPLNTASIEYVIRPETGAYFLNPPLSTRLIAESGVSVSSYTSGVGLTPNAATVNYQGIDLDGWAQQFLGVFDQLMSPDALSTIYSSSPTDFQTLLGIRETLVENITKTVQPVVSVSDPNLSQREQAAKAVFTQQLDQALLNAYRVDSIVQFATEVTGVTPPPPPISSVSMNDLAKSLGISLLDFVAANYGCNMLNNGASVTIDGSSIQIGSTNLLSWFNGMTDATQQGEFIDGQHVPIDTPEMEQLGAISGILVDPSATQQVIGAGSYSSTSTPYSVALSSLGQSTPDLVVISNSLMLGGFSPQPFYVAQMLKDVVGLFNKATIQAGLFIIPSTPPVQNPQITFGPSDTLQSVYDQNIAGKGYVYNGANSQQYPVSLWDMVMMDLPNLKVDPDFAQHTLYFAWTTPGSAATPNTTGLTYIGKPVNSAYTLPVNNTLNQIVADYQTNAGVTLDVGYIGDVLADQLGLFNGQPIPQINVTPTGADTLTSLFNQQQQYTTYTAFIDAIAADTILAAGKSLPLFWQSYGQPLTLASAANALGVDVSTLVWSNYNNAVWLATPGDASSQEALAKETELWVPKSAPYPISPMPALIYQPGYLVNTPALGVLSVPVSGGNLTQLIPNQQTFDQFVVSLTIDTAVFVSTYIGELLKNVKNLFASGTVINNLNSGATPASYTVKQGDTLLDIATTFGFTSDQDLAQFVASYDNQLVLGVSSLTFQWTALSDVAQPPTIQQMANYFNLSAQDVIEANWDKPNFIAAGVAIGAVETVSGDTLSSLAGKLPGGSAAYPPQASFYNNPQIIQNPTLFIPFSQPGVLVLQPGLALTSATSKMAAGDAYLTFMLSQSGEPQERVGVNLTYQPFAVRADAALVGGAGMQLQLLAPLPIPIGSSEVPIPLRSYPNAPTLTDQMATPVEPASTAALGEEQPILPISEANEWMYSFGYTYQGSSQDEMQVSLLLNGGAGSTAAASALYNETLFQSLASFMAVLPALSSDLNLLPSVNGASTSPVVLNAISSFIALAQPIAQNWTVGSGASMQNLTPATPAGPGAETFSFTVQDLYDAENDQLLITVSAPSGQTLPGRYSLPVVAPDKTIWQIPTSIAPPADQSQFTYSFSPIQPGGTTPDNGKRTVTFDNELNVLQYGSAAGQLNVLRNQDLLYGMATTPAFVYQTPSVTFQQPVKPMIDHASPVAFSPLYRLAASLTDQYTAYLTQMFDEMYGADIATLTTAPQIQIAIGYRLALANTGIAALTVLIPLAMQSRSALTTDTISELGAKLADLRSTQQLNGGQFEFDIALYNGDDPQPVLRLQQVQMPLDATPIQSQRFAAEPDPDQAQYATDLDAVNPLVVNASRLSDVTINTATRRLLSYGAPVKLKSWFSGMAWADNTTLYYNNGDAWRSRQTPIYADPIIALYVCQLAGNTLPPQGQSDNYLAYFTQTDPGASPADNDMAVYVQPGWEAGFHLSMPNPTMLNSAAFNSGNGLHTYNNDALIFNANLNGYQPGAGADWLAASTTDSFDPSNPPPVADFTTNSPLPEAAWQAGLCQYAVWRDTLAVSPVTLTGDVPTLAFTAAAAKLADQGAFHAQFVMENDAAGSPNQRLSMTITQGSPLTQFTGSGIDGARIAGIFNPTSQPTDKATLTPGGIYPSQPESGPLQAGSISGLTAPGGSVGTLNYLVIYQQVNLFHNEKIPEMGNPRMNWVSFAIFWNPAEATAQLDASNLAVTLLFNQPQADNFFVVAGLPNQMSNSFDPETDLYDSASADAWAQKIGPTAFNYLQSSQVTYNVDGNQVYTNYLYTFEQVGPVAAADQTVILLQPHQYLDPFNAAGTVLAPGALQPLFSATPPSNDSYWMARGRLWAQLGANFSIVYTYPNLLPNLPIFDTSATRPSNAPAPAPESYNLIEMAAAIIGNYWVSDFTNSAGNTQTSPATTGMANTENMQDTYNVAKTFYRAAKILPMLLSMTQSGYFNSQDVMDHINGTTVYNSGTSYYAVGANIQDGKPVYFTPGGALHDFVVHLIEAFDYYFGGTPMAHVSRAFTDNAGENQVSGKSFYYSYYDPNNHHLFIYPASGAGGIWPTNRNFSPDAKIFDGYGTVSMLNDHAYTYGYLIAAASTLLMVLKTDLSKLNYTQIDGSTGKMGDSVPVATPDEYADWLQWLNGVTPVIDALMMDLAYTPGVDTGDAQGFQKLVNQTYPEMEFLDQWTGISWTDGFLQSASIGGHNANSPWEEMLAWVGVIEWGYATQRQKVAELGIYLYTTALYSLEYYNYNVPQTYLPENITSETSANGDFIPRAANDFSPAFSFYPDPCNPDPSIYSPLTFAEQPFQGRAMTETTISDSPQGTLPGLPSGKDHRTAHVTYFYQSNVRSDNTYWNSPVGMLSTAIYPQGAFSLGLARHAAYMADWINAINFQNGRSYYQSFYPTLVNLLSAMLGMSTSLVGDDFSSEYITPSNPNGTIIPIPGAYENYGYSPLPGDIPSNPQRNAFLYLTVNSQLKPYDWYWNKASGINQHQTPADNGTPPWQSANTGETLSMYVPPDVTEADYLLYFYSYDVYGIPDFTRTLSATWADSTTPGTPMLPMGAAWRKVTLVPVGSTVVEAGGDPGDGSHPHTLEQTQWTYMVYNPNSQSITVSFGEKSGGQSQPQSIPPNQLFVWTES